MSEEQTKEIKIKPEVAFNLKIIEFDKDIAELESRVASLKSQKMRFIYDTNINSVMQNSG